MTKHSSNPSQQHDIISLNDQIIRKFEDEIKNLPVYESHVVELDPEKNGKIIQDLQEKIQDIKTQTSYNIYLLKTAEIIQEYRAILSKPVKMNFMGVVVDDSMLKVKHELCKKFIDIASDYIDIVPLKTNDDRKKDRYRDMVCECGCTDFHVEDETYVCVDCFAEITLMKNSSSYKDSDRVNIYKKYTYNRKIHFRDCINQYQGKQNCTIDPKIYDDLEKEFENNSLLIDSPDKKVRYSRITKQIIMMFLKEMGYSKHYENINLIHYHITGIKPDDISHLEAKLMHDFDRLTELYDKLYMNNIDRKNFINTQYVLYQLLKRHKHPCKQSNFSVLKTVDRKTFHDEICKELFLKLNWNHTSDF